MAYQNARILPSRQINDNRIRDSTLKSHWGRSSISVLGVLDHHVVLNGLDRDLNKERTYVDDLTIIQTVSMDVQTVVQVDATRNLHEITPNQTQRAFRSICKNSTDKGQKINKKIHVQVLSISSAKYDTVAKIEIFEGSELRSSDCLKMLRFAKKMI